jgi:hypothetical protein
LRFRLSGVGEGVGLGVSAGVGDGLGAGGGFQIRFSSSIRHPVLPFEMLRSKCAVIVG